MIVDSGTKKKLDKTALVKPLGPEGRLQLLNSISVAINESLGLNQVLQKIIDSIVHVLGYDHACILNAEANGKGDKVLRVNSLASKSKLLLKSIEALLGHAITKLSVPLRRDYSEATEKIWDGEVLVARNFSEIASPPLSKTVCDAIQKLGKSKTSLSVPVRARGEFVASILITTSQDEVSAEEIDLLKALAAQAGIAISNAQSYNKALAASEEKYRTLFNSSFTGTYVTTPEGKVLAINKAGAAFLGYKRPEELIGKNILNFYKNIQDRDKLINALNHDKAHSFEFEMVKKDGTCMTAVIASSRATIGGEQVILTSGLDITERKQAEQALRLSQEKFSQLYEAINQAIAVFSIPDLEIIHWNKQFAKLFCAAPGQDLKGTRITEFIDSADLQTAVERLHRRMAEETVPDTYEITAMDMAGKKHIVEITPSLYKEKGQATGVEVLIADVTERKQAEELAQALMRNAGTGVYILQDERFQYTNSLLQETTGYTEKELIGVPPFDLVHPEDRKTVREKAVQNLKGHSPHPYEYRFMKKNGEIGWALEKVTSIEYRGSKAALGSFMDTTKQKQTEEVLRQSEEKYRTIVESVEDGYFEGNTAGKLTFFNDSMCRILGYSKDEMMGMDYHVYTTEEYLEAESKTFAQVYQTGEPVKGFAWEIVRKDGGRAFVEASIARMQDITGEVIGARGILRDVTERKQAEEALKQSEERYRTILDDMEEGYFETDIAGHITFLNNSMSGIFGYPEDQIIGTNYLAYLDKDDTDAAYKFFNQAYMTGKPTWSYSTEIVRKDGKRHSIEIAASLLRNQSGDIIGFRGVTRDITERKRAEEALKQSEERYRTVLDDMEEGYFETDIAGHITFLNNSMSGIFGYPEDQIIGTNYLAYLDKDDTDAAYKFFNQAYMTGKPTWSYSTEIVRKDGKRHSIEIAASLLRNQSGDITGFRGVTRDITERKSIEQQLLATSKLASVGELAAGVAHEINNPLTGIMGYSQLLTSRQDVPQDIKADLDKIYHESQRAAKIVQNLLSFARQHKPEKGYLDINELVQRTLELRSYELKTSNIETSANLTPGLPQVIADSHQIQQVLLNLFVNAEQAIAETKRRGNITVNTGKVDNFIRISISDNGHGIPKDNIDKVFDPFFTTKEVGTGTGLGLSICHGIIAEHGGNIYVDSKEGKGATFTVELPLTAEDQATAEIKEAASGNGQLCKRGTTRRVLIVDDEPAICDILTQALTAEGHRADAISNAKAGLKKIIEDGYDIYIIDLKMPQISGKEIYEVVKQRHPDSAQKMIFITGDTVTAKTRDFLNSTGRPYLTKPFDFDEVTRLVTITSGGVR